MNETIVEMKIETGEADDYNSGIGYIYHKHTHSHSHIHKHIHTPWTLLAIPFLATAQKMLNTYLIEVPFILLEPFCFGPERSFI